MRRITKGVVFAWIVLVSATASAQATLTGLVKDTSGAVLPGVTVEAASPVLIEKVRSAVTDAAGRYQIVDLRPGPYTVTFTLAGFNVVKREGIQLTGSFTATADAELRVGAVAETITVTGETPTVDLQSTTRQRVINQDLISALPTSRNSFSLGVLIPGVAMSFGAQDVGGAAPPSVAAMVAHGGKTDDQRLTMNGVSLSTMIGGGWGGGAVPNATGIGEIAYDTAAVDASLATGGVRINFIPRDGGNQFRGTVFGSFANDKFQGDHFREDVGASPTTGLPYAAIRASYVKRNFDFNPGFGGPLKRDKLWFFLSGRAQAGDLFVPGVSYNKNANNPSVWAFEADTARGEPVAPREFAIYQARFTWQASTRHKFGLTFDQESSCFCPAGVGAGFFGTNAPEAGNDQRFPVQRYVQVDWNSPISTRLLLEASGIHRVERWGLMHLQEGKGGVDPVDPRMISVTNSTAPLTYRSAAQFNNSWNINLHYRAALSYITGSHNIKVGFNNAWGHYENTTYTIIPYSYNVSGPLTAPTPVSVTLRATPFTQEVDVDSDLGVFAQDKWTVNRWTVSAGVRYDHFKNSYPDQTLGPGPFTPTRNIFYAKRGNLNWHDITPKLGLVYDLFGNGRTALKASLNKYLIGLGTTGGFGVSNNALTANNNPIAVLTTTATRPWNDSTFGPGDPRTGNFVPDCNLLDPAANGECLGFNIQGFGTANPTTRYDSELLTGWNKRHYNWEFSAGVQHEILPRVSVDVSYFRRWYGNFQVTDNLLVSAADYDRFNITGPTDRVGRLPAGDRATIAGVHSIKPAKVGQQDNFVTLLKDLPGDLTQIEHWDGVDISANARLRNGFILAGGMSTGRTLTDNCEVANALPEVITPSLFVLAATPLQFCHRDEGFITQVKALAAYMIPRVDVQISGTFQSLPGPLLLANYNATAADAGRPFTESPAFRTVQILEPGSLYGDRLNQLDLRFAKLLRFGTTRTAINFDFYNITNAAPITSYNAAFANWLQPNSVLQARFFKISAQFDF